MMPPPPPLDDAFAALRARLGIRTVLPPGVLTEAERVARERDPSASPVHADRTALPFVTIDPRGEEVINLTPVLS
jgi:exoribonuclease R